MEHTVYGHRRTDIWIAMPSYLPPERRSMIRCKQRIVRNRRLCQKFLTLTYSDDHLTSNFKKDIGLFKKRLAYQLTANKEKFFSEKWDKDWIFSGYYPVQQKLEMLWRFETNSKGDREYNPHFHCLINVVPFITNKDSVLTDVWNKGFIEIKHVKSLKHLKYYVSKYMSKDSGLSVEGKQRHWTCTNGFRKRKGQYRVIMNNLTQEHATQMVEEHNISIEKDTLMEYVDVLGD